jgi:NitT/TauT family transport system substrate-binding protein
MKRFAALMLTVCTVASLVGCSGNNASSAGAGDAQPQSQPESETKDEVGEKDILNMAYQYGLAYAPLTIAQEKGFIEESYKEVTGRSLEIVWTQMSSGPDINTGIASGTIDVGFMGVGPAVTGVTKGLGYKIFTNLSGQEHGLIKNDDFVNSLGDLVGSDKQIALVNIGAIQHVILGMALSENGYDAHAPESNNIDMKHPDSMTTLET